MAYHASTEYQTSHTVVHCGLGFGNPHLPTINIDGIRSRSRGSGWTENFYLCLPGTETYARAYVCGMLAVRSVGWLVGSTAFGLQGKDRLVQVQTKRRRKNVGENWISSTKAEKIQASRFFVSREEEANGATSQLTA